MTKQLHESFTPAVASELDRAVPQSRRPWQTPMVILSTMSETGTGAGATTDGGGSGNTHS
jgi:hypothetical protein